MNKKELVKLLYDNFYDKKYNSIILEDLNFSEYACDLTIENVSVSKKLYNEKSISISGINSGSFYVSKSEVDFMGIYDNLASINI